MHALALQDEVLAHRLGLVPILADPHQFEYREDDDIANEGNTIGEPRPVKCTVVIMRHPYHMIYI